MSEKYTKETEHNFNTGETEVNIVQGDRLVAHSDGRASMLASGAIEELNDLQAQLATAHAAREAAEAERDAALEKLGNLAIDSTSEHNQLKALQAKLDTLTNALTSMVLGADSNTPIGEIQDRVKVWLEDKEALQAENARLVAAYEIMRYIVRPFELNIDAGKVTEIIFKHADGKVLSTPIAPQSIVNNFRLAERIADGTEPIPSEVADTTPPATEPARYVVEPFVVDGKRYGARVRDTHTDVIVFQCDANMSVVNDQFYEQCKAQAQARADELNANES